MTEQIKKSRIAPTPSGYLHLGNVYSFSLTAALARRAGYPILLRIDDLDRERVRREYVDDIFETLRYLDIPWDEGPRDRDDFERSWSQVHRLGIYRATLEQLREKGKVYACDCSRLKIMHEGADGVYAGTCREKGLSLDSAGRSWRVRTGDAVRAASEGSGLRPGGHGSVLPAEMADFIVKKKDGFPAYQLTSLADDLHFGIGLIVRGEDLRASTAAQQWLSKELGKDEFGQIRVIHHPLLLDTGMEKLSKSAGSLSVQYLRRQGVGPAEMYSMIGRRLGIEVAVRNWQELAEAVG